MKHRRAHRTRIRVAAATGVLGVAAVGTVFAHAAMPHDDATDRAGAATSASPTSPAGESTAVADPAPSSKPSAPKRTKTAPAGRPGPKQSAHEAKQAADGSCGVAPSDSIWRQPVDGLPAHQRSGTYVSAIGGDKPLHPDFGAGLIDGKPFGIPVTVVDGAAPQAQVGFDYDDESDHGGYGIPDDARVENGPDGTGDRHVIVWDRAKCASYELYDAHRTGSATWHAGSGAIFDLRSNKLRPDGWTSADAAGLPILPGLVRYDEVAAGDIAHALRITVPRSDRSHVWPARHDAGAAGDQHLPPMGLRLRLKASVDISSLPPQAKVIATALKRYGAMVADNGSSWFVSGDQDERWDNDQLNALKSLKGSDFEAVDVSGLQAASDSGAAKAP
ncbi:hypothetical protein ACGFT2_23970 [Streptomyces sp. NPDC048514]|uniref:hypothetical protein n=1 Tax=Streptomyces sp. NPDC048514 TaxID=3365564 RepID=UPI0037230980